MPEYVTYEEFGRRFFEIAVNEERVGSAFADIAGGDFTVGPIPSGPGGMAKVWAQVEIDEPQLTRQVGELITFTVKIPLRIGLLIDLKVDRIRYDVAGLITLPLTVRAAAPLELRIEVDPPKPKDVWVDVESRTIRGSIVRVVASVDSEIRRFIAQYVAEEIDKPEIKKARIINVSEELGRAFHNLGDDEDPQTPPAAPAPASAAPGSAPAAPEVIEPTEILPAPGDRL
ncbi:hypothetical protein LB823_18320 [Tsukamurella sp. M9C]|nr:hypothetical protein [Tsukamurella sp. M9C]MCA0158155.1 hypothetical protein [Tsukamurella sp. M9C]